jgi:hypothetical protein
MIRARETNRETVMKQVYQELASPLLLEKDEYGSPYSSTHGNGNLAAAYALFKLIDPVSSFTHKYSPTSASFSKSYKTLLHEIEATGDAVFIVNSAIKKTEVDNFAAIAPGSEKFFLVDTTPYDLYKGQGTAVSFMVGPPNSGADYVEIGSSTKREVSFNGFVAYISRPWFDERVFEAENWRIRGYSQGALSSGTYDNGGILPLIPVQLMISVKDDNRYLVGVVSDIIPKAPAKGSAGTTALNKKPTAGNTPIELSGKKKRTKHARFK